MSSPIVHRNGAGEPITLDRLRSVRTRVDGIFDYFYFIGIGANKLNILLF